jgi:ribosomal-protein-alanine N-acetyltransferase
MRWVRFEWPLAGRAFPEPALSGYRIRGAAREDLDAMLGVVCAAYASDPVWRELLADIERRVGARIRESLGDPRAHFVVAEREGRVVGLNGVALDHPTGQNLITGICVVPEHQGRGLGTALLSASLAWLRDQGLAIATVTTDARSIAARVYERLRATRIDGAEYPDAPRAM